MYLHLQTYLKGGEGSTHILYDMTSSTNATIAYDLLPSVSIKMRVCLMGVVTYKSTCNWL